MTAYSITYDLKSPGRNYQGLYDAIKNSGKWWHFLESTWIVISDETVQQIWSRMSQHVDNNDFVLIVEIRNNKYGSLPAEAWTWIDENVAN